MKRVYEPPKAEKLVFDYTNTVVASGGGHHGHGDQGNNGGQGHGNNYDHWGQGCKK